MKLNTGSRHRNISHLLHLEQYSDKARDRIRDKDINHGPKKKAYTQAETATKSESETVIRLR